jgi:hypothetical protein
MRKQLLISVIILISLSRLNAQKQPIHVQLEDQNSFSMIVYPDPQNYAKYDVYQPLFELMTTWTANNKDELNIKAVLCTGDLVDENGMAIAGLRAGNQNGRQQWESTSRAFKRLDNLIPYVVCTGNHDYGYVTSENRQTHFPEYFYPERSNKFRNTLVSTCVNWQGYHTLENAAYEFIDPIWGKLLVVVLEFAPRDEPIDWAKKLVDSDKYKDHTVFLLTHSYLSTKGERFKKENYLLSPANYGETIWERLVYPSPNIKFVLCGHAAIKDGDDYEKNVSFRTDKNIAGNNVPQMMFNAQTAGGGWSGNGGDGWLRILEFMPDGKTVSVRTFSPLFAISPKTAHYAWRTESYDQFKFIIE